MSKGKLVSVQGMLCSCLILLAPVNDISASPYTYNIQNITKSIHNRSSDSPVQSPINILPPIESQIKISPTEGNQVAQTNAKNEFSSVPLVKLSGSKKIQRTSKSLEKGQN